MTMRRCELCATDMANDEFGEHMDGHSDSEFLRWPGGIGPLMDELADCLAESEGHR